jgi:hypothetical protein
MKRKTALVGAAALALPLGLLLTASPASAGNCGENQPVTPETLESLFPTEGDVAIQNGFLILRTGDDGAPASAFTGGVDLPLADGFAGSNYGFTGDGDDGAGSVGYHLVVDMVGLDNPEHYRHLVWELVYNDDGDLVIDDDDIWWSDGPLIRIPDVTGQGSPDAATLAEFSEQYPNARILGFGLETGAPEGVGVVDTVTFGCSSFDFLGGTTAPPPDPDPATDGELPDTGVDALALGGLGAAALAAGGVGIAVTRSRRNTNA